MIIPIMNVINVKRILEGDLRAARFKFHMPYYKVNMEVECDDLSRKAAVSILANLGYDILGVSEWVGNKVVIATKTHKTFSQARREMAVVS